MNTSTTGIYYISAKTSVYALCTIPTNLQQHLCICHRFDILVRCQMILLCVKELIKGISLLLHANLYWLASHTRTNLLWNNNSQWASISACSDLSVVVGESFRIQKWVHLSNYAIGYYPYKIIDVRMGNRSYFVINPFCTLNSDLPGFVISQKFGIQSVSLFWHETFCNQLFYDALMSRCWKIKTTWICKQCFFQVK